MAKTFIYRVLVILGFVVAAVFWLLSVTLPDTFGWFNLSWAITIFAGVAGVSYLLRGLFVKTEHVIKNLCIYLGAGLLVIAFLGMAAAIAAPGNIVLPVIAIIVTFALLISLVAVGGRRWDIGDNQKGGHKTYYQRKAEAEAQDKDSKQPQ